MSWVLGGSDGQKYVEAISGYDLGGRRPEMFACFYYTAHTLKRLAGYRQVIHPVSTQHVGNCSFGPTHTSLSQPRGRKQKDLGDMVGVTLQADTNMIISRAYGTILPLCLLRRLDTYVAEVIKRTTPPPPPLLQCPSCPSTAMMFCS